MSAPVTMERLVPFSRPQGLGTRRRTARRAGVSQPGASRFGNAEAPLLDTEKALETTAINWRQKQKKPDEKRGEKVRLHNRLCETMAKIAQKHLNDAYELPDPSWIVSYFAQRRRMKGESLGEAIARMKSWQKKNPAPRGLRKALRWDRAVCALRNCQKEWVVYNAECCADRTRPIAVPIGCGQRLCPFCAHRRSEIAQRRAKILYDRLAHPWLLTLTVPNTESITKGDLHWLRKQARALIGQYECNPKKGKNGPVRGGLISLETTYNADTKMWHPHVHILLDSRFALPTSDWGFELNGRKELAFGLLKKRIEFDWMRLWSPWRVWDREHQKQRKKQKGESAASAALRRAKWESEHPKPEHSHDWGRPPRATKNIDAWRRKCDGDRYEFESWLTASWEHKTHTWNRTLGIPVRLRGLSDEEFAARTAWNAENRRDVDLKPLVDREKGIKELLKYVTKVASFVDIPDAVEAFSDAARGARLIQTFGTWYGVELEVGNEGFDPKQMEDWNTRECECGLNCWTRVPGTFTSADTEMDASGRWQLKAPLTGDQCRGSTIRPTIRALRYGLGKEQWDGQSDTYDGSAGGSASAEA